MVTAARGAPVAGPPDDFEAHARKMLASYAPQLLADFVLIADATRFVFKGHRTPIHGADTPRRRTTGSARPAAKLLGPERFQAIFGFSPDQKINLVDPTIKQP